MKKIELTKQEAEYLFMAIEDRIESFDGAIFGAFEGEIEALEKVKGQLLGVDNI